MADTIPANISPLYPLANAKGTDLLCELCQKPAFIQCSKCRVTYYCGPEHQRADWIGIHAKICDELAVLRKPVPFLTSEKDRREKREELIQQQLRMIVITRTTGQKLLFENHFEEAVPAALQSLKFAIDVHGSSSVELVPSYLILGEASIGLQRLSQAEEYLSQAQWTVLKTDNPSNAIKSQLHRNLGLLFSAKGDYGRALENLAIDIFHASDEYGTEDIRVSGGYFSMANIFMYKNKQEIAYDLFGRVIDIWYDHLWRIVQAMTAPPDIPDGLGEVVAEITQEEKEHLDEAQQAEALKILHSIYSLLVETSEAVDSGSEAESIGEFDSKTAELLAAAGLGDSPQSDEDATGIAEHYRHIRAALQ
uniref:MYND-type domain-containing protein n=1 Tax=Macrostomum lignano TaxID=282301 RepID=A0A1I8GPJ1_9PLAT